MELLENNINTEHRPLCFSDFVVDYVCVYQYTSKQ